MLLNFQVAKFNDPRDACAAIVAESYRLWLQYETRTDDITVIVVHINGLTDVGASLSLSLSLVSYLLYIVIHMIICLLFCIACQFNQLILSSFVRLLLENRQILVLFPGLLCHKLSR